MTPLSRSLIVFLLGVLSLGLVCGFPARPQAVDGRLVPIGIAPDGAGFVRGEDKQRFVPWGFNYVGKSGQIAEETWDTSEGWQELVEDFREMRDLGANVVRWHMQFATYMTGPDEVDETQLARLKRLLFLAHETGLYLDLTGLNLFRKERIPRWYDELPEAERWKAQAKFWSEVARMCAGDPAVFCYDLTNEPVIGAPREGEHPWVTGELGGFYFVQRISHNRERRPAHEIAEAWVRTLRTAIREHDPRSPITVGVIPWAFVWKNAKPVFYAPNVLPYLDIVSIHVYPKSDRLQDDIQATAVYDLGKPLVVEEIFTLGCSIEELDTYIEATKDRVDGWIAHYFGKTPEEHRASKQLSDAIIAAFLEYWKEKGAAIANPATTETE